MNRTGLPSPWRWGLAALSLAVLVGATRLGLDRAASGRAGAADRAMIRPIAYIPNQEQLGRLNLSGGVAWLNTAGPIRAESLRGKVVLLDFWTYCCINCHHVLPDLLSLEQKYKSDLVVIGVHTAKFDAEKVTANIREKVREYGIRHPVVNDADQLIWRRFGVESWPTIALFDTRGNYVGAIPGEGHYAALDKAVGNLIAQAKARGELDESPINFHLEDEKVDVETPLRFPGKVLADTPGGRLFISDTGHNRIVVTDLKGGLKEIIGNGATGLKDGTYEQAQFNRQQGMCLVDDVLYVADVENHAIRAVDLKSKSVETLVGNGTQSRRRTGSSPLKGATLNSPWDLVLVPNTKTLLIAMAGPHQIWKLDLEKKVVGVWAGNSYENIVDGPALSPSKRSNDGFPEPSGSSFAQPSGLATDGKFIYVADSEGSCIRAISLASEHRVSTLLGQHDVMGVLFSFGDVDGVGPRVRLQHCLGLAYYDGKLYIADTYNNKIKVCDPAERSAETLAGSLASGSSDDPARFFQPGGLSVSKRTLYVADSNNGLIRTIDLKTRKVSTLTIADLQPPKPPRQPPKFPRAKTIEVPETQVGPGDQLALNVSVALPAGQKLNGERPMPYLLESPGKTGLFAASVSPLGGKLDHPEPKFSVKVPFAETLKEGEKFTVKFSLSAFVCKQGSEGFCKIENFVWNVPVVVTAGAPEHVDLSNPH